MRKLTLSLVVMGATLSLAAVSMAQQPGPGGPGGRGGFPGGPGGPGGRGGMRPGGRMAEMQKKILAQLKLTADQKKKVDALEKKSEEKRAAMFKDFKPGGDMSGMRDKMRAAMKEHHDGLAKILTKDQMKKYDELMKAEREKMRAQFGGRGGGFGGGRPGGPGGPGGPPPGR